MKEIANFICIVKVVVIAQVYFTIVGLVRHNLKHNPLPMCQEVAAATENTNHFFRFISCLSLLALGFESVFLCSFAFVSFNVLPVFSCNNASESVGSPDEK